MSHNRRVGIIASGAGVETAYKVLNIATAAAAMDAEVAIFFTFDGLAVLHKRSADLLRLPPEKEFLAQGFRKTNVPSIQELLEVARESGVRFIGCQMTMDVMGITRDDLIDGVEIGGAAAFLDFALDAGVSLSF